MNLQEIRVSGLLEQYVIGALNPEERAQVTATIAEYPQLKEDISLIGDVLRAYHNMAPISPPDELKNQVLEAYKNVSPNRPSKAIGKSAPAPVKKSNKSNTTSQIQWGAIAAVLAAVFALACAALFFMDRSKINDLKDEVAQLQSTVSSKDQKIKLITTERDSLSVLSDPNNKWYSLKPSYRYPSAQAYLIKNTGINTTYAKIKELPELPEGRSYKLWIQDAIGVYEQLPVSIESLSGGFMNEVKIPLKAVRLVISVHRDDTDYLPTPRTIAGTIEL
jgi:anti-sigma-K factor RskA